MNPDLIRLPEPRRLFAQRAGRLRRLADERPPLAAYLGLLADMGDIQDRLAAGYPPMDPESPPRVPHPHACLQALVVALGTRPAPLAGILARLGEASEAEVDDWVGALLAADPECLDAALAPFVAAAVQVPWSLRAAGIDPGGVPEPAVGGVCPVCGGLPVAGLLRTGAGVQGLRYLCCSLCGTQWHRVRLQCIQCGSAEHLAYFGLEGAGRAVRAEACGDCRVYLKLFDLEQNPALDPLADDLATLPLDLLLAGEGYRRLGFNPFLIPGR